MKQPFDRTEAARTRMADYDVVVIGAGAREQLEAELALRSR
jgi:hypothetical protein